MERSRQEWQDRLAARGWSPTSFVVMARVLQDSVEHLIPRVIDPTNQVLAGDRDTTVDWRAAYSATSTHWENLLTAFDPQLPRQPPEDDRSLGAWMRHTLQRVERVVTKVETLTDQTTGLITDEAIQSQPIKSVMQQAEQDLEALRIELKATVHNLTAFMMLGKSMVEVLEEAQQGKAEAVHFVLSLNPALESLPDIRRHIERAFVRRDNQFLTTIVPLSRVTLRKRASLSLILGFLWEAGLKRLTYKQLRGFLKTAGLSSVPTPQALERYAQRLGLKKYTIEKEG